MGFDFSGEVVKTGNLVRTFHEGEHVYGMLKGWRGGTYAEFIAIKPEQLATIPGSLSHPPVLVLLALTLRDIELYPLLKWALVSPP